MSCLLCFHRCVEIFFLMDALLYSFVSASRLGFEWGGSVLGSPQKRCWGLHREGHGGPAQPAAAA